MDEIWMTWSLLACILFAFILGKAIDRMREKEQGGSSTDRMQTNEKGNSSIDEKCESPQDCKNFRGHLSISKVGIKDSPVDGRVCISGD